MEDKIYTTSTQYRLFTYTPQQLSDLRHATNRAAAEKITASIKAARAAGDDADSDAAAAADEEEIDCPTAEEELKLVAYYCVKCMQLSDHFKFPSAVKATALTFLHRLYLTTSTLTLHPKKLLLPILYLATKTENYYTPIDRFIATALTAGTTITKDDLISPEFKIAMGLRWAFQIWHPFRGLEGIFLELNAMHQGTYASPQHAPGEAADAKRRLEELAAAPAGGAGEAAVARIGRAHGEARAILTSTALLTDVYFLYTPPQISFAAFLQADRELAEMYLDVKFPAGGAAAEATKRKLLKVVGECAERHLAGGITRDSPNPYPGLCLQLPQNGVATSVLASLDKGLVKEVTRVDKKLYHVTNRDKKANGCGGGGGAGKKEREREGNYEASAVEEERKAKKRRLEREKLARDGDVFGGVLHQAQE
ncbi:cyclin-like protein [Morchella snyderi]|nr:cyclin-like protein [Morchella snyderi]